MSANVWGPESILSLAEGVKSVSQSFTATEGQREFTLTSFLYTVDTGATFVIKEGAHLELGRGYFESNSSTIILAEPCVAGERVVIRAITGIVGATGDFAVTEDAATRAGRFLIFDVNGDVISSQGTGADAGLRGDLATSGTAIIAYAVQVVGTAATASAILPVTTRVLSLDGDLWDAVTTVGVQTSNGINGTPGTIIAFTSDPAKAWHRRLHNGMVDIRNWGAVLDGVTPDSEAHQAAVNFAAPRGLITFIDSTADGCYIDDQISCPVGTKVLGLYRGHGFEGSSKIIFDPATPKSLYVPATTGSFVDGYSFENLFIEGNSLTAGGNSIYAIDMDYVIKSQVKNVRTSLFRYGIRCYATIHNRFEDVHITNSSIACVLYAGNVCTTDTWDHCYLSNAPLGVEAVGTNLGILWTNNTIFETLENYGMNLCKETYGWQASDCYAENVGYDGTATNAMFRIGYDGATLAIGNTITVDGGYYGGRNAGGVGSLFDINESYGVILGGFFAARWTNIVNPGASVETNRVVCRGWDSVSVVTQVTDVTKCTGIYPAGVVNSSTRNGQRVKYLSGEIDTFAAATQADINRLVLTGPAIARDPGTICMGNETTTTVGAAGGASALPATPAGYVYEWHGATRYRRPYYL